MLNLDQRECRLGDKYGGKKNADTEQRTLKLQLEGLELSREEVNAILGEPHAYEAIYDTSANPIRPYLPGIKALELSAVCKGARVVLFYELGKSSLVLKNTTVSKIRIEPQLGGATQLSCVVEGEPEKLDRKIADIIERVGAGIECEIEAVSPDDQSQLPLNTHGTGEQPEVGEERPRRRAGVVTKRNGHGRRPAA